MKPPWFGLPLVFGCCLCGYDADGQTTVVPAPPDVESYGDGRPTAPWRMDASDHGIVLRSGDGPDQCDYLGAREALVYEWDGTYYLHYDGAGPTGWRACLATSKNLVDWSKHGPVLQLGRPGENDGGTAASPWVHFDGTTWHMFYVGSVNTMPPPDRIPAFPYLTLKARSQSPSGPWIKQKDVVPFRPRPGTYFSDTASPGHVLKVGDEYRMFFSAATLDKEVLRRTLGIARTKDLDGPWQVDPEPIVPLEEQIENSSLYFESASRTWFLFTNHVGIAANGGEYTDAIWVYWSKNLDRWNAANKAVVLDGRNCTWSKQCIGLPSVLRVGKRLAILYDAPGGESTSHMRRHVGLAWMELPLKLP